MAPKTDIELPDFDTLDPIHTETIGIEQLTSDPHNARRHTKRNLDVLEKSIEETGLWRSISIDENNVIYAGNATVEVAGQMGIGKVRVIDAEPDEIVAVRRRGLTQDQKTRYGLFDNRASELAEWDEDVLASFHKEGFDFASIFSENELAQLMSQAALPLDELQTVDTQPIEVPLVAVTNPGDIWVLGDHLLVCGDARVEKDVRRLLGDEFGAVDMVFTDPPYNVSYVGKTDDKLEIQNDKMSDDEFLSFLNESNAMMFQTMKAGCCYYMCHAGGPIGELFMVSLRECKLPLRQQIIWAKNSMVMGHSDFHYKHEPIAYGWKEGPRYNCGDRTLTTLWEVDRPSASREHPTMKPTELVSRALVASSRSGDLVYDPFGGAGSTLLSCEVLSRRCRMMEIDPIYCDVIVKRFTDMTGMEAKRFNPDMALAETG